MRSASAFGGWLRSGFVVVLAVAAIGISPPVFGADLDPSGKPEKFEAGNIASYYVWRDRQGWHMRTTTKERKRKFHGAIRVIGGEFGAINTEGLETTGAAADCWKLSDDRKQINFSLQTEQALDGFDFRIVGDATRVEFSLKIDDDELKTNRINIGAASKHPDATNFSVPTRRQ